MAFAPMSRSRLTKVVTCFCLLAAVSACGSFRERVFGSEVLDAAALPYRASLSRGANRRDFTVSVKAPGATLDEARESARFRATLYCIERYGGSIVDWVIDPETEDWAVARAGDRLVVGGRCVARA